MRPRGAERPEEGPDERRDPKARGRRWGRSRSEAEPEEPVAGEEFGWIDDLRTAKRQRTEIGPETGVREASDPAPAGPGHLSRRPPAGPRPPVAPPRLPVPCLDPPPAPPRWSDGRPTIHRPTCCPRPSAGPSGRPVAGFRRPAPRPGPEVAPPVRPGPEAQPPVRPGTGSRRRWTARAVRRVRPNRIRGRCPVGRVPPDGCPSKARPAWRVPPPRTSARWPGGGYRSRTSRQCRRRVTPRRFRCRVTPRRFRRRPRPVRWLPVRWLPVRWLPVRVTGRNHRPPSAGDMAPAPTTTSVRGDVAATPRRTTTGRSGVVGPPIRPSPADRRPVRPVLRYPARPGRLRTREPLHRPGAPPGPARSPRHPVPGPSRPPRRAARPARDRRHRSRVRFRPCRVRSGRPDRLPGPVRASCRRMERASCRRTERASCRRPVRVSGRRMERASCRRPVRVPGRRPHRAPPPGRHRAPLSPDHG
ncbi:hypothetical protein JD81_03579 [Micromonospora sagamiensis]|uniref:Basic proline-rich protein n=1 Tax=Micromonospora sagamiensis TaxID=47875 RepID=A0A562WID9_9ACTN|nr:hypothetical protein JD81_03579 [Micromonospora sagamiensis]